MDAIPSNIYDFKVSSYDGKVIDFSQYKGKKILIVNTPVEADYAHQYVDLEALYQKYKGKLVIIGFLADDFQIEPGSAKSTSRPKHYPVTFPLGAKVLVRGSNMGPVFKWLTEKRYNNLKDNEVAWDFQKYLINENGQLVTIFHPSLKANNSELIAAIEK